ncbi:GNAT family N-acetyltransferase [Demequina activiva]|uniref:Ribosomal protein N-acetyltransferase n=1 Tax=Demequina activiva TaxID=1582364 RepID=A0A919UJC5_9MICO|nr:GNAT family protein [Demequina activiva]GIG54236.1 ribosomal protein N-acetyltransferase [Demequina activiva]
MAAVTAPLSGVPTQVRTRRLLLRPFRAEDAENFDALVMSSIDHLLPWEPWAAHEPHPLERRRRDLADLGGQLQSGAAAHYAIELPGCGMLLGSAALVTGAAPDRIEIGYWLGVTHTGCGYATEAATALTHVALRQLGLPRLELWADARNLASNAVARRTGYRLDGTRPSYRDHEGPPPLMNVWLADAEWSPPLDAKRA